VDKGADVLGLGAVLFELFSLSDDQPFSNDLNLEGDTIEYPDCFHPEACDLIGKMLKRNPSRRIALEEVAQHPWMVRNLAESGKKVMNYRRFGSVRHILQQLSQKKTILFCIFSSLVLLPVLFLLDGSTKVSIIFHSHREQGLLSVLLPVSL